MNLSRKFFILYQLAFWTVYFAYNVFVVHFGSFVRSDYSPVIPTIYLILLCFFGIPLTTFASWFYNRVQFRQRSTTVMIFTVIGLSLLLANCWVFEIRALDRLFNQIALSMQIKGITFIPLKTRVYIWEVFVATLLLVTWSLIYLFIEMWQDWHLQKYEISNTRLQLENARLKILTSQISPHFLFNSLSSLRALIRSDAGRAEAMLSRISDFLRYSLETRQMHQVPLKEEIEAMNDYLAIEKVRFTSRLSVDIKIDESAAAFPVPSFILHPLVENAVKHGMATSPNPLKIEISATVHDNTLTVSISNTGEWLSQADRSRGTGTGLAMVRQRLAALYSDRCSLEVVHDTGKVSVQLNIHREPDEDHEARH